jgi:hypothetical protein
LLLSAAVTHESDLLSFRMGIHWRIWLQSSPCQNNHAGYSR